MAVSFGKGSGRALVLVTAVLLATVSCGTQSFTFGDTPGVVWWTDHETGDTFDWTSKDPPGGMILTGGSRVEVTKGIARSGQYSLLIQDTSAMTRVYPLAGRNGPLPLGIYCSAWYYLPEIIHPKTYWWYVLFRSRHPPYGLLDFRDEIRLSFRDRPDGTMGSVLLSEELGTVEPLVDREIPVGRWFHIESYLVPATDDTGEFRAWQDGELLFEAKGKNMETTWAEWMVGGVVDGLLTEGSTLYIDDAAVSNRRLGPVAPFSGE